MLSMPLAWFDRVRPALLVGLAIVAVAQPVPSTAQTDRAPTFYELADDPGSLQLIDLNGFAGSGANTIVVTVDLFRGQQKFGLRSTWRVDCTRSRMTIIEASQFAPGWQGKPSAITPEYVARDSSAKSRLMFDLACTGGGDLQTSRTYFDDLPTIAARFWR